MGNLWELIKMNKKATLSFQNYIILGRLRVLEQCGLGWQVDGAG